MIDEGVQDDLARFALEGFSNSRIHVEQENRPTFDMGDEPRRRRLMIETAVTNECIRRVAQFVPTKAAFGDDGLGDDAGKERRRIGEGIERCQLDLFQPMINVFQSVLGGPRGEVVMIPLPRMFITTSGRRSHLGELETSHDVAGSAAVGRPLVHRETERSELRIEGELGVKPATDSVLKWRTSRRAAVSR